MEKSEMAYFATGCFWGAERRFWQLTGVLETSVGYMGGNRANPSY
jgi:peptide-methionine (S)-S-oxide reductase